ncbi:MAG: pantoate--beta-alanine ligase [Magnetococcales bacterium]|nr:pantoate--beta-alanine ligase [Magnetococcales bacterium]
MEILRTREELTRWRNAQPEGAVGFVPTMGALHEGHLTLVRAAGARCPSVIASIFVNPTQFGPQEDFARYPRQPEVDADLLASAGCRALFLPTPEIIYPPGHATSIHVEPLGHELCGAFRPTHFQGVATVVAILLNLVRPSAAFFGLKDYQQFTLIRRMVADLVWPYDIVGVPTVREADGLAMSSRNRYLTPEERARAAHLHRALRAAESARIQGTDNAAALEEAARAVLTEGGIVDVDYVAVRHPDDLTPWKGQGAAVILAAVRLGKTRLIDNWWID